MKVKQPAFVGHLTAMIKMMEQEEGPTPEAIAGQYIREGLVRYSDRAALLKILKARWLVWKNFQCRPPKGEAGFKCQGSSMDGWTVPRDHLHFNPRTMIPREPRAVKPAPMPAQPPAPEVDFSCD